MDKDELLKMAKQWTNKATRNYDNYQATGERRYYSQYIQADNIADACTRAARAAEDHTALITLRVDVALLADKANRALASGDPDKIEEACEELLAMAAIRGLTRRERK